MKTLKQNYSVRRANLYYPGNCHGATLYCLGLSKKLEWKTGIHVKVLLTEDRFKEVGLNNMSQFDMVTFETEYGIMHSGIIMVPTINPIIFSKHGGTNVDERELSELEKMYHGRIRTYQPNYLDLGGVLK